MRVCNTGSEVIHMPDKALTGQVVFTVRAPFWVTSPVLRGETKAQMGAAAVPI